MHAATPDPISPLLLSDRLITMAEQAGQAGYRDAALRLITLACQMLNTPPRPVHVADRRPAH
jgi:hypothetical protein